MIKLFITGGTGFIGKEIVDILNLDGCKIYVLTRQALENFGNVEYIRGEISDTELLEKVFKKIRPKCLLHLAWNVKSSNYAQSAENNLWVDWSQKLLEIFLKYGGEKVIVSGTCFEYEFTKNKPIAEDEICKPATPYGKAKLEVYGIYKKLCESHNAKLIWGRIFYPYGRGESARKLISAAKNNLVDDKEFLCKAPQNVNDYINVRDVAKIFQAFIKNDAAEGIYNVGTGRAYKIGDILNKVAQILGKEKFLTFGNTAGQNFQYIVADTKKLRKIYRDEFITLEDGLDYVKETLLFVQNVPLENNAP